MRVGVTSGVKDQAFRVAITPAGVQGLVGHGPGVHVAIVDRSLPAAVSADPALALGVSTVAGHLVSAPVAEAHGLPVASPSEVMA